MIDFKNAKFFKLSKGKIGDFEKLLLPLFVEDEVIIESFKGMRDGVVFTNKRLIAINVQGFTGSKKDFTSIPYSKIQLFSVETAGTFDMDSELVLYLSGAGAIKFEFTHNSNVTEICKIISDRIF